MFFLLKKLKEFARVRIFFTQKNILHLDEGWGITDSASKLKEKMCLTYFAEVFGCNSYFQTIFTFTSHLWLTKLYCKSRKSASLVTLHPCFCFVLIDQNEVNYG